MILSDQDIAKAVKEGRIGIEPFDPNCLQPSSYDLHLGERILVFDNHRVGVVDVREDIEVSRLVRIDERDGLIIHPGEFVLGSTLESFRIPSNLAAKIEGRSSLGRLGLIVHATAGFVDPGFEGELTFEISNISRLPIRIYPKMRIAQICFFKMSSPARTPYGSRKLGSKYKGQKGPTRSKIHLDFERKNG